MLGKEKTENYLRTILNVHETYRMVRSIDVAIEEYTVHAMTSDGFIQGAFKVDVLEVKVNEVYAGVTDKETFAAGY